MKTEIIYEDGDILVIYKPAGIATQSGDVGRQDVAGELKNYIRQTERKSGQIKPGEPYLGVIHRLDQPVEGLLVFARNKKAAASLNRQLQERQAIPASGTQPGKRAAAPGSQSMKKAASGDQSMQEAAFPETQSVQKATAPRTHSMQEATARSSSQNPSFQDSGSGFCKYYYTVIYGLPEKEECKLEGWLCKKDGRAEIAGHIPESRIARLQYSILQKLEPQNISLADIQLETGRFHQIRAQMAHSGMPLLGDLKYGSEASKALSGKLAIRNVALCAYRLEFLHPVTGKKMRFQVKPKGMAFSFFSQL